MERLKNVQKTLEDKEISFKSWLLSDQAFEKLGELMFHTLLFGDEASEPRPTGMLSGGKGRG